MPTGSNRTVCCCAIPPRLLLVGRPAAAPGRPARVPGPRVWLLSGAGRRPAGRSALLVRLDVLVALLLGHLVERHVGARERVALDVVERPELLGVVEVEVRLGHQRLAVVPDV